MISKVDLNWGNTLDAFGNAVDVDMTVSFHCPDKEERALIKDLVKDCLSKFKNVEEKTCCFQCRYYTNLTDNWHVKEPFCTGKNSFIAPEYPSCKHLVLVEGRTREDALNLPTLEVLTGLPRMSQ